MIVNSLKKLNSLSKGDIICGIRKKSSKFYLVVITATLQEKESWIEVIINGFDSTEEWVTQFTPNDYVGYYLGKEPFVVCYPESVKDYPDLIKVSVFNPKVGLVNFKLDNKSCFILNISDWY